VYNKYWAVAETRVQTSWSLLRRRTLLLYVDIYYFGFLIIEFASCHILVSRSLMYILEFWKISTPRFKQEERHKITLIRNKLTYEKYVSSKMWKKMFSCLQKQNV